MQTLSKRLAFFVANCVILCLSSYQQSDAKIRIITTAYNRPDFIEIQHKTFKKFLKDDYEYMVFSDADNPAMEQAIEEICKRFGVTYVRVPQNLHNVDPNCRTATASFRHGEAMQFALERSGFNHDDIVMTIDSDVFLIREFSIREYLGDCGMMGFYWKEQGAYFIAPNFGFMNIPLLNDPQNMNFRAAVRNGRFWEAGQQTQDYIGNHPEIKWKERGETFVSVEDIANQLSEMGYTSTELKLIQSIIAVRRQNPRAWCDIGFYEKNIFLDYKHGSGWNLPQANIKATKDQIVKEFFDTILN